MTFSRSKSYLILSRNLDALRRNFANWAMSYSTRLYFPQVKRKSYPEHIDSLISSFGLLDVPLMITHQNIHTQKKVLKIFWGFQVPQIHLCIAIDSIFFTISKFDKRILQVSFNFASGNSRPCHVKRIYRIQRN